jgi:hypothetical protein
MVERPTRCEPDGRLRLCAFLEPVLSFSTLLHSRPLGTYESSTARKLDVMVSIAPAAMPKRNQLAKVSVQEAVPGTFSSKSI